MGVAVVSPVFVGRQQELGGLASEVSRVAGGEPGFVLVGGEAGVGKTRLVEEAAGAAGAAGFRVLSGRCVELGPEGLPLAPLVEALRALARSAPPEELRRWLGPARGALARLLPSLDATIEVGGSGSGQAAQLPELVLGVVERVSASQPLLLIFEDLHWADQSTLDLLAHLVRALREVPVLIVVTYRSDEIHRRHPLRPLLAGWERVRTVRWLELARFDRDEVAAQVTAILDRPAEAQLVDVVLDRSEGNAFLVEEIVGMLSDDRDPGALSPSLRDVLLVRVEPRSADAQRVLRAAAVSGRQVPERLLAAVVGTDPALLLAALRELVDNHLLVVDDTGQGYAFRHKLARDAVYDDMLPGERVNWHAAYGRALAESPELAGDDMSVPAALAHHWFTALDLPAALPAYLAAAAASSTYAPAEELRHLERALEIWPRVPAAAAVTGTDVIEMLRAAADAAVRAGSVDRALSLLDQALADLGETGSASRRALLLERRAHALRDLGNEAQSLVVLRQAQDLLPAAPAPLTSAHAIVLTSLANSLMNHGDMTAAQATATQAVTVAVAVGAQVEEAEARITLAIAQAYLGDGDNGLTGLRAGLCLAEQIGAQNTALRGHINHSDVLEMLGRHQEAIDAATAGLELAQRIGSSRRLGPYLTGNLVEPLLRLGRWEEAERTAVEAARNQPVGVFAATLLDLRAQLAVLAGRRGDAERLAAQTRQLLATSNSFQFQQSLAFTMAETNRLAGDLDSAAAIIAESLTEGPDTWFERYSWPLIWLGTRIAADRAILARDRRAPEPDDGQSDRLATITQALPTRTPPGRGYAATTVAERSRLTGSVAVENWTAAVQCWRAADEPYPLAYCLLRLAEDLCTLNARREATTALREAARLAAKMGAAPLSQEAEALARRARLPLTKDTGEQGTDPPGATHPATAGPDDTLARFGLTEREREVLQLLAVGRSNAQIASTLFISPKTASVHVSNILAKLGVTGRVEAAALVHRLTTTQTIGN
jgi:DNA-binding CsgD family transcriptional regulator/tetratricopeptide (TPR) repeat protein